VAPHDQRIDAIDALRGLALFGVLAVNLVSEFRVSMFEQFLENRAALSSADRFASAVVSLGMASKAICLFSLLFGFGLAMQFEHLSKTGQPHYWLARRLFVLLGFGLIHLLFIWNGDILTVYALAGFLVLPFLGASARWLGFMSAGLFALYAAMPLLPAPLSLPSQSELQAHVAAADAVYPTGRVAEIWRFSVSELRMLLPLHAYIFPRTLALFFLGAYVWRTRLVLRALQGHANPVVGAAGFGMVGAVLAVATSSDADLRLGVIAPILANLAPIALATGYACAVIALFRYRRPARWLAVFAPMGRMAFTNYVSQSLIFCLLFFGYGLGLYGQLGVTETLLIGISVYVAQLAISTWWLGRFRYGPLEWCWRSLMHGKAQPMLPGNDQARRCPQPEQA
jgi:uncharacterized protein